MKNSNVIQFPKEQITQKKIRDSRAHSRATLGLSLLSVLMVTLFLNQLVGQSKPESVVGNGRGIASIGTGNNVSVKNVQWEHELAEKLAAAKGGGSDSLVAGFLGEKPSLRDELIFGALDGKYGMNLSGGRIQSLSFIASGDEKAILVENRAQLLNKFNSLFVVAYSQAALVSKVDNVETYQLIDSQKSVVGTVKMTLDLAGRLMDIKVQ